MTTTEAPLIVHHDFPDASIESWFGTTHRPNLADILAASSSPADLALTLVPELPVEHLPFLNERPYGTAVLEQIGRYQPGVVEAIPTEEPQTTEEPVAEDAPTHPDLDLPGSPAGVLIGWTSSGSQRYRVIVERPIGRVEVRGSSVIEPLAARWAFVQGTYDTVDTAIECYRREFNLDNEVLDRNWPGQPLAEEPVTPVGHDQVTLVIPTDLPPNAPAGILLEIPDRGYRVVTSDGAIVGSVTGNWGFTQRRPVDGMTQAQMAESYCTDHGGWIINPDFTGSGATPRTEWIDVGRIESLTPPPPAAVQFTDSRGNVLAAEWFEGGNGLDWTGHRSGAPRWGDEVRARRTACEQFGPHGLGVDRWYCSRENGHEGHHIALSGDNVLGEWGREHAAQPDTRTGSRSIPLPRTTTSSGISLVPTQHVSTTTGWAVTRDRYRLPLGADQQDFAGGYCDRRSPRALADLAGDYFYCTRRGAHEGHHASANTAGVTAEWDLPPNVLTLEPGQSLPPEADPELISTDNLVRVMRQFALSHCHDNSLDALKIGLARLGVDLGELPTQEYEATIQISVPVRFARGSLAGTTAAELTTALPQDRIRDAVRRFLAASKLAGEGFGNLDVQADRISIHSSRPEEI